MVRFKMITWLLALSLLSATAAMAQSADTVDVKITEETRLITIGSSITETVFALGGGDHVVGVDASSTYPPKVHKLPKVPYIRELNAEGILSLSPDVIITNEDARPRSVLTQLRNAGVRIVVLPDQHSPAGAFSKIRTIGRMLGEIEKAESLIAGIQKQLKEAKAKRNKLDEKPSVLFLLSAGSGQNSIMAAGANTAAHKMIAMAGGKNILTDMSGYKPVNPEVIASANPEYIIKMKRGGHEIDTKENMKDLPGIGLIRAVEKGNIIAMDGNYLLGFGPRTGKAVLDLMSKLHEEVNVQL